MEDYCLTCRAGGVTDDLFIIQFLPIYLAKSVGAWLDHLPRNTSNCWDDLWDLRAHWQPLGPKGLPVEVGRAPLGLHLVFFRKMS
jgi:hypothetical protein